MAYFFYKRKESFGSSVSMSLMAAGGCRAVLSETPAGRARGPSVRRGEGRRRHRGAELPTVLQGEDLLGWEGGPLFSVMNEYIVWSVLPLMMRFFLFWRRNGNLQTRFIQFSSLTSCKHNRSHSGSVENQFRSAWVISVKDSGVSAYFAEAFLWAPRAEDGSPGVLASWRVDERPEGF